jgi:arylsulfatase A
VKPRDQYPKNKNPGQLYNIAKDPYETDDIWDKNPEVVRELTALLYKYKKEGRSTPPR